MKKLLIAVLVLVALYSLFEEALPWKSDGEAASPPSGVLPEEEAQPAQTPEDGGGAEAADGDGAAEELDAAGEEAAGPGGAEDVPEAGHTYAVAAGDVTWEEARQLAEERGGYLAAITSQEEWDTVQALAEESGLTYLWLGGQAGGDGAFGWLTGEAFDFSCWYPGEPSGSDSDGTAESFLCMWKPDGAWSWNDQRDDIIAGNRAAAGKIGYVIEYEAGH